MSPVPRLTVIIPVHNPGPVFRACLEGLADSVVPPDEVIVVFDGAGPEASVPEVGIPIRLLRTEVRSGPAHARNIGAQAATGDILLFLDSDVIPASTLTRDVAAVFREAGVDAVIGSYDSNPGDPAFLSQYRNLLHHYMHQTEVSTTSTFWGACGAVRHDVFWEVGGFHERFDRPCIEDIELGYRMSNAGYRIEMHPELQVKHMKKWTPLNMLKTDTFDRALPWARLMLESHRLPDQLNLRLRERWSAVAAFLFVGSAAGAFVWPAMAVPAVAAAIAFIMLCAPFYRFLLQRRGLGFMLRSIPWHLAYYLCCGTGAGLALILFAGDMRGARHSASRDVARHPARAID